MKKNNSIKIFFFSFTLFFFVCTMLTGCDRQKEPSTEITVLHGWGSTEADHESMRRIYEDFQKEHPEITLNILALPSDMDVIKKTRELLTAGKIPDVIFTAGEGKDTIYKFMLANDYALDLMPYIENDEELRSNISPLIFDGWMTSQGGLYTISDVFLMGGYWYNRTLFEQADILEPPKTWAEFEDVCLKLSKLGKQTTPQMKPLLLDTDHIVYLTNVILHETFPEELANIENGIISLQAPGFQASLNYLKKISQYADTVNAYSFRDTLESFNNKETAIYMNGVWGATLIDKQIDAAYAAFPSENGDGIAMISSSVGYILGNTGDTKRTNASIQFLKYMLSESVGERLLSETSQIPSNPNVKITEALAGATLYQAVSCIRNAADIIEFPANFWSHELQEKYGEAVISYLNNDRTLEQLQEDL